MVPAVLQEAVVRTYAKYLKKRDFDAVANEHHRQQWRLARGVAIVAVQYALGQISEGQMKKILGARGPQPSGENHVDTDQAPGPVDPNRE